jgi:hypothetical protein
VATGHGFAVAVGADLCGNRFDDEGRVCAEAYGRWWISDWASATVAGDVSSGRC